MSEEFDEIIAELRLLATNSEEALRSFEAMERAPLSDGDREKLERFLLAIQKSSRKMRSIIGGNLVSEAIDDLEKLGKEEPKKE